ncbi:MAG: response regulator, partial [Synergistaceae bacterium]|nr:response regulator [Synergistaceae bacterium]
MNWRRAFRDNYPQLVFVFAAFFLMVLVSYFSVSSLVRRRLEEGVSKSITAAEANIRTGLVEMEVTINNLSYFLTDMLDEGASQQEILDYLTSATKWMQRLDTKLPQLYGIYSYIRGEFIDGIGLRSLENFKPQQSPWFDTAVRNRDSDAVSYTEPYEDPKSGAIIISAVRNLRGRSGERYGILAIDMETSWFRNYVRSLHMPTENAVESDGPVTDGSYGIILNPWMVVVGHPKESYVSRQFRDICEGYRDVYDALLRGDEVLSAKIRDFDGTSVTVSFRKVFNGWYIGVVTPFLSYYRDVYYTAAILSTLGSVLMVVLGYFLLRLYAAKMRSDEENQSKSSFLATMSHEIRTPLNVILGLAEVELEKRLNERTRQNIEKMYSSASTLLGIINDILDISKIEAGGIELNPVNFDVSELLGDAAQLNVIRIGSKPIVFEMEIDETLPARLYGDELRVKQVLNNLLSNAFKYTKEGRVVLQAGWRQEAEQDGKNVTLLFSVRDTGIGIRNSDIEKLFAEYVQLDAKANRHIEGTGLGLSITKGFLDLMGGKVSVESEYGVGSAFSVEIPLKSVGEGRLGREGVERLKRFHFMANSRTQTQKFVRTPIPDGRVLVVDDVVTNQDVARGLLTPYGLQVDCVSGGAEAIEKIRQGSEPGGVRYDAVFMDHMMPEMDGIEATRIIREELGTEYART